MKILPIADYQKVELNILKQIHNFCEAKGITYFLFYGSLIGALRHGGPIPWDDDIDIVMPRPDYDRFMREFPDSEKYRLFAFERGNSMLRLARVCDIERTKVHTDLRFVRGSCEPGVWVDITPLDGAFEDVETESKLEHRITVMKARLCYARQTFEWVSTGKNLFQKANRIFKLVVMSLLWIPMTRRLIGLVRQKDYEASEFCAALLNLGYPGREVVRRAWFSGKRLVEFAGMKVYVPLEAEKILEKMYGDWKTPPPVEKRMAASHYLSVEER